MSKDTERLYEVLRERGYREYDNMGLWQKEAKPGCYVNFRIDGDPFTPPSLVVGADITFGCSPNGRWCKALLYQIDPGTAADKVDEIEGELIAVFDLFQGGLDGY